MGKNNCAIATTLALVACANILPSWTQETKTSKDKAKSESKTWPRTVNYRGLTPLERASSINVGRNRNEYLLDSPESSDWRQVADLVKFSPPNCLSEDDYAAKTEEGKKYSNIWSKQEGTLVTSCLAYLHKYCPSLFKVIKGPMILKKISLENSSKKEICFLEDRTLYFRSDLFKKTSNVVLLSIGAALVRYNGLADNAYQHPDWANCLKRIEPAAAYLKNRYSALVIEDIDGNLAKALVAPNISICSQAKAALEQTLVVHQLSRGRGTPFECHEFLTATIAGIKVKQDETTISAKNKTLVDKLNTVEDLKDSARILRFRYLLPVNGAAGYVVEAYKSVIMGRTAGSYNEP